MIANGLRGWPPAAARPSSSAAPATRTSTPDVLHGDHDEHRRASCYGKRARLVRRGAAGKGPGQLAPRRRPTLPQALFGKRPTEKDPAKGTSLALHFTRSGGAGNGTSHVTAPAPDLTRSSVAVCLLWVCAGEPGRDVARGDLLERCPVRNAFADVVRPALERRRSPGTRPRTQPSPVRCMSSKGPGQGWWPSSGTPQGQRHLTGHRLPVPGRGHRGAGRAGPGAARCAGKGLGFTASPSASRSAP